MSIFMLAYTDIDIPGSDLRAQFASFAFVITDRHVLSIGERLLSRRVKSALRGLILRVATVYVTQRGDEADRALDLNFAFDALGDDLPELISHTLTLHGEASLQTLLSEDDLNMLADPPVATANPLHGLIKVIVNAMLYATSSGVATEARSGEKASTSQTAACRANRHRRECLLPARRDRHHAGSQAANIVPYRRGQRCSAGAWCADTGAELRKPATTNDFAGSHLIGKGRTWPH